MDACRQTDGCCCQECMGGNEQFTRDELVTLARIAGQLFNEYGDRNDILSRYQRALVRGVQATS